MKTYDKSEDNDGENQEKNQESRNNHNIYIRKPTPEHERTTQRSERKDDVKSVIKNAMYDVESRSKRKAVNTKTFEKKYTRIKMIQMRYTTI